MALAFSVVQWRQRWPQPERPWPWLAAMNPGVLSECVRSKPLAAVLNSFPDMALNPESLAASRDDIIRQLGPVTILIAAAGGNRPDATLPPGADFCKLPRDAWNGVFDLNLVGGSLLPCQVFGETMLAQKKGSIINIASMAGMIPLSRVVAYSAAKAAVINLTKFLAREWATRGVRVNAISPGFFPADQNRALLFRDDGSYTERGAQIIGHTPMARFGDSQELSGAVIWLASHKASSFVTGQNIVVDGGFSSTTI
ncbi:MAG UNVERIFIED_CONTAM: SDR family oxidoreductase [Planctomycetaceae bacterium]